MRIALPKTEHLNSILAYDASAGLLFWKSPKEKVLAGRPAGCVNSQGYRVVTIAQRQYRASRIIWKMVNGTDPVEEIDHINGNRFDNRISNLREATSRQNKWNISTQPRNTSGFKGVDYNKKYGFWRAAMRRPGKASCLGFFLTKDQAFVEYCAAACELHGEFARVGVAVPVAPGVSVTMGGVSQDSLDSHRSVNYGISAECAS